MSVQPGALFATGQSGPELPSETLGQCFQYLPFLDRFRAAQVSRYWRACALSFPLLWADIDLSKVVRARSQPALLDLLLSRSALCPVDFKGTALYDAQDAVALVQLLNRRMHQFRSFVWYGPIESPGLISPAPRLERYVCTAAIPIPSNFLGGHAPMLRHVELGRLMLPETCPALAGVTHLITSAPRSEEASSMSRIFTVFPSLVFLSLEGLPSDNEHLPNIGRAPSTLAHLSLQTKHADCSVGQYAAELVPEECKDIRLSIPVRGSPRVAVLLQDAQELTILVRQNEGQIGELASIVVALPAGRVLTVEFESAAYVNQVSDIIVSGMLVGVNPPQLRALTMPLYTVQRFFRTRPTLPSLFELCIIIPQADLPLQVAVLDLTRLYCLALLRSYALSCCTLDISTHRRPSTEDAAGVLEHIAKYGQAGVRYVLRGFPSDVVDAVPIPAELGEFDVHFE